MQRYIFSNDKIVRCIIQAIPTIIYYHKITFLVASEVEICNKGNQNCGKYDFCGGYLSADTKEPYCLKCAHESSKCANNLNPGWQTINETCDYNWNCKRSSMSRSCFSVVCTKNRCKPNEQYQECLEEETEKRDEKRKGETILAVVVMISFVLIMSCVIIIRKNIKKFKSITILIWALRMR